MILEEYVFTSCFLNDIQGLIEQKKQSGPEVIGFHML